MRRGHVPAPLLDHYAAGGERIGVDVLWALEAHLEACAACRARLAEAVGRRKPATVALLERVHARLDTEVAKSAQMPARRSLRMRLPGRALWWAPPALLPRLAMTVLVVGVAFGLDLADSRLPSLVLLLAPVAPLLGVAAAWSRGLDPAHELACASPRAGLSLVLQRTLAVLAVVIPALAAGGLLVEVSPARWLLPCLAFTAGALALGGLVGLQRAAVGLALGWVAVVVAPSLITARTPVLLAPASLPGWAGLIVVVVVALVLRGDRYTQLPSGR
jgi:hypothetical protein